MKIHPDQQDELNERYWMPMQSALGDSLTVFIWHYLMRNGGNIPQSDAYLSYRKATAGREVSDVLAELARYAPTYARLLNPELEMQRGAGQRAIRRLHRTRLTVAYPLTMRLYDQVRHGRQLAEATLLAVFDLLENYALRGFIARRGIGGANKSMQTLATRTNHLDEQPEALLADIRAYLATQNYPSDADVYTALQEQSLYHHAGERHTRTKLLLDTLEADLNPKETVLLSNPQHRAHHAANPNRQLADGVGRGSRARPPAAAAYPRQPHPYGLQQRTFQLSVCREAEALRR